MPVPERASVAVEVLPVKVKFAEAAPLDCGANVAVKETLLPAATVTGNERPVREYSELLTLAADTTTLAPEALRVAVLFIFEPTATCPKLRAPGVTLKDPVAPAAPESGTTTLGRLESTVRLPLVLFEAVGVNVTFSVMLCPAANVSGSPGAVKLNWLFFTLIEDTVTFVLPLLVKASGSVLLLPTCTPPKLRFDALGTSNPELEFLPPPWTKIVRGEFVALLVRIRAASMCPTNVGVKVAPNCML
jgi:hypothetical protein